ncbi:MAG: hypothetical protein LBP78_08330 [Acidaminococcales bacterium]|jgi:hypothetical protein|nr:hypothetical protein [Acidaminococcales bacterium]
MNQKQRELTPFVAIAIAENYLAREGLDRAYADGLDGLKEIARQGIEQHIFYRGYDVLTRWHCHRAEALIILYSRENERGEATGKK